MRLPEQDDRLVVRMVDALIAHALSVRASDIHVEPQAELLRIRYRIDGILSEQDPIDAACATQVITRIKVLAGINTVQRRMPQDGKCTVMYEQTPVDIRISTFPCVYGETVVLRLLDRSGQLLDTAHLGLSPALRSKFLDLLKKPHGLLLVTGPTGCGKTTTLYAALSEIHTSAKNIITLEDPVEYAITGITQGSIDVEVGFSFEQGVRAMLRQDPDIMLVGEIRDRSTARVAIEAALTGHLVLSTLHTNDATSALMRLMDMGVEPFLINAALIGVLAQRLVRAVCRECVQYDTPAEYELQIFNRHGITPPELLARAVGCDACAGSGYRGRTGIFELLPISDALRMLIVTQPDVASIYAQTAADGMQPLAHDALAKVADGRTTVAEVLPLVILY